MSEKQKSVEVLSTGRAGSKGDDGIEGKGLLPCPFCGGKAKLGLIVSTVNCSECGARAGEYNVGYKAIEAWNKRQKF